MSSFLNKAKDMIPADMADKVADAVEENLTSDKVDAVLSKTGAKDLADKLPDNVNEMAADAVRDNLGTKKDD